MRIKKFRDQAGSMPFLGKLKKGDEKSASGFGKDLDDFRFHTTDLEAAMMFAQNYGNAKRPADQRLPIMVGGKVNPQLLRANYIEVYFAGRTPDDVYMSCQEAHTASAIQHRCDGEFCTLIRDPRTGVITTPEYGTVPCPGGCKQVAKVKLILKELRRAAYVVLETHSTWDIMTLQNNIDAAYNEYGALDGGRTFLLYRKPTDITYTDKATGKSRRITKSLLNLEATQELLRIQMLVMHHNLLATAGLLPDNQVEAARMLLEDKSLPNRHIDMGTGEIIGDAEDFEDEAPTPVVTPNPPPAQKTSNRPQTNTERHNAQKKAEPVKAEAVKAEPVKEPTVEEELDTVVVESIFDCASRHYTAGETGLDGPGLFAFQQWIIRGYTKATTPNDVRFTVEALTDAENADIVSKINADPTKYLRLFMAYAAKEAAKAEEAAQDAQVELVPA